MDKTVKEVPLDLPQWHPHCLISYIYWMTEQWMRPSAFMSLFYDAHTDVYEFYLHGSTSVSQYSSELSLAEQTEEKELNNTTVCWQTHAWSICMKSHQKILKLRSKYKLDCFVMDSSSSLFFIIYLTQLAQKITLALHLPGLPRSRFFLHCFQ